MQKRNSISILETAVNEYNYLSSRDFVSKIFFRLVFIAIALFAIATGGLYGTSTAGHHRRLLIAFPILFLTVLWFIEIYIAKLKMSTIYKIYAETITDEFGKKIVRYYNLTDIQSRYVLPIDPWLCEPFIWMTIGLGATIF